MADIEEMTATEQLDWLGRIDQSRRPGIDVLLVLRASGLTQTDWIESHPNQIEKAGRELSALTRNGTRPVEPPLSARDVGKIIDLGHSVYEHDRDNVEQWCRLVEKIVAVDEEIRTQAWQPRFRHTWRWTDEATKQFIAELLDAGRGPLYGRELVARAAETGVSPDSYGYSITPSMFSDLAKAGVGGVELDRLAENGIDRDEAIDLISAGIPAGAVVAAISQAIPRERWRALLPGMHPNWFPLFDASVHDPLDPVEHGILSRKQVSFKEQGWTWGHLRRLVDAGWNDVGTYSLRSVSYGHGRAGRSLGLDADTAVRIAEAGIGYAEFARWLGAFAERSRTSYVPEHVNKPLFYIGRSYLDEIIAAILAMKAAKVSPSNITDYRWVGCASVDDILMAATAGINGPRVKYLRGRYGQQRYGHDPKHLANVGELLSVHEKDLTAEAESA